MQALPFATQLLGRLGAEVVKVEHPVQGESGRGAHPAMADPQGRLVGATFLRNNLGKRSVGIDLKAPEGRDLFLDLVPRFDVVAENFKAGTMDRLGLSYAEVAARNPGIVYVSVSGFGNAASAQGAHSPYRDWPAYASVVEAMSGVYEWARRPGEPPRPNPVGALGDISSALFAVIGVLAALRERDRTGRGQQVDVAMLDALLSMTDVVTNMWSLGVRPENPMQLILEAFAAADGYVVVQIVREHQFERLAELIGHPEWLSDERFASRAGWVAHLDDVVRPALEGWMSARTRVEATAELSAAGIAAGICQTAPEVIADEHVAARNMLVAMERTDGVDEPVLIPGNPVKLSELPDPPDPPGARVPWVGEHTASVLRDELALSDEELRRLADAGVISP
ncbi:MAG: CoA transferase [Acidimicrobiales bacterium]|nr:CoA transferase [Acidimicrobiales bacterium]MCB9372382.1 CoA transferase [Microthrixaceae bacterium]